MCSLCQAVAAGSPYLRLSAPEAGAGDAGRPSANAMFESLSRDAGGACVVCFWGLVLVRASSWNLDSADCRLHARDLDVS